METKTDKPETIEDLTLRFWTLSKTWNGRIPGKKIVCHEAFDETNDILCYVGPGRPLKMAVYRIEDELVREPKRGRRKKKSAVVNLSNLHNINEKRKAEK